MNSVKITKFFKQYHLLQYIIMCKKIHITCKSFADFHILIISDPKLMVINF